MSLARAATFNTEQQGRRHLEQTDQHRKIPRRNAHHHAQGFVVDLDAKVVVILRHLNR
jgi:hypothetical protein